MTMGEANGRAPASLEERVATLEEGVDAIGAWKDQTDEKLQRQAVQFLGGQKRIEALVQGLHGAFTTLATKVEVQNENERKNGVQFQKFERDVRKALDIAKDAKETAEAAHEAASAVPGMRPKYDTLNEANPEDLGKDEIAELQEKYASLKIAMVDKEAEIRGAEKERLRIEAEAEKERKRIEAKAEADRRAAKDIADAEIARREKREAAWRAWAPIVVTAAMTFGGGVAWVVHTFFAH